MHPFLIVFATREGHTGLVAQRIADVARSMGAMPVLQDARDVGEPMDLLGYSAVVLAASVHAGKHEREMQRFVELHRDELLVVPTAFLSVSLTEAGVEMRDKDPAERLAAADNVAHMMDDFFEQTQWHPDRAEGVAGALMYSKYNLLIRWIMKRIAAKEGASTDTSRDHVYTDWDALEAFTRDFVGALQSADEAPVGGREAATGTP